MREFVEAGYVSLVELERGKTAINATLYNDKIDIAKHRVVNLVWLVRPMGKAVYGVKNLPTYTVWNDVHLYSLEATEVGKILRVLQ